MTSKPSDVAPDRSVPLEIELKLALPPAQHAAFLRFMARRRASLIRRELVTRYFDTPDFALGRRGIAVRVRRIGRDWVQTFKTEGERQGGLSTRIEHEMPVRRDRPDWSLFPETVRACVPPAERRRLVPVFETRFTRTAWTLGARRGRIEVALDDGEIRAGQQRAPLSEIEIELVDGQPDTLFDFALKCARAVECLPFDASKAERGMRLAREEAAAPVRAASPVLDTTMTREAVCVASVQACLGAFQANLPGVLADGHTEFLHEARIALRRLRVALRLFRPVVSPPPALLDGLKAIAAALGTARDWDVLCDEMLPEIAPHFGDDRAWNAGRALFDGQRQQARAAMRDAVREQNPGAWLIEFQIWLRGVVDGGQESAGSRGRQLAPWVRRRLDRLHRRLVEAASGADFSDERLLHALRIDIKRLRYALELVEPLFGRGALAPCRTRLQKLQQAFGEIVDRRMALQLVASLQDDSGGMRSFVRGWLAANGARHSRSRLERKMKKFIKSSRCW